MTGRDAPKASANVTDRSAACRYEAWMGRAVLAFPPRWRESRGAELIEVSRALSTSDGADRPSIRELADVIRGGFSVRLRDRPPLWRRQLYRWARRPVPRRYWGWMRDDMRSRFFGVRIGIRSTVLFATVCAIWWPQSGNQDQRGLVWVVGLFGLVSVLTARRSARDFRARIHMRIGFDLVTWGVLAPPIGTAPTPPTPPPWAQGPTPPVVSFPAARIPIRHFAWPIACWALVSGAALIAGAALPNGQARWGAVSYAPDPNSPLTAAEVARWSVVLALMSVLLIGAVLALGRWRLRAVARVTAHPVNDVHGETRQMLWAITSVGAVPALAVGLSGILPDLGSTVVGSALVLGGAGLIGLALLAKVVEPDLGRPVSVPDLIVGERWTRRWGPRTERTPA